MAIPESQLETWSHQGAITSAKATHESVRNALDSYDYWPDGIDFEVYLQGSYKNSTNIRGDSDVDIVAQLNSTFYSNLSNGHKQILGFSAATYGWFDFRADVLKSLKAYYGQNQIIEGNKSIKIKSNGGRLAADVVVCAEYRSYRTLSNDDYAEGMCFWTRYDYRQVVNYPKIHYDNGVWKHQNTNNWYKPFVRLLKNCRGYIPQDTTPSYFLECLLYNVPNSKFGLSYQDTFCNTVIWLNETNLANFVCQNGQIELFGPTKEQWDIVQAEEFIKNLSLLWNTW